MRLGLIGWGVASGNGGMNTDIARLSDFVTKWLIPKHPYLPIHDPYIFQARESVDITFMDTSDDINSTLDQFLDNIDGILYIEHPILNIHPYEFDLVSKVHARNKKVTCIIQTSVVQFCTQYFFYYGQHPQSQETHKMV